MSQTWNARLYEDKHSFVWKSASSLLELLAPQPGESILDLGCGTGQLTSQIAATGANVLGVDLSGEMIAQARANHPNIAFELVDARRLPYEEQFEAIFSNAVLHWVPEAEDVIRGVTRALKPGGRFVAEFGGKGNVKAIMAAARAEALGYGQSDAPWYFPSVGEYASLLEKHGLEVTFATLFDRLTPLEGPHGIRNWLEMFGGHYLRAIPPEQREAFFRMFEDELRPTLYRDNTWYADYRRLRVVAYRTGAASS